MTCPASLWTFLDAHGEFVALLVLVAIAVWAFSRPEVVIVYRERSK